MAFQEHAYEECTAQRSSVVDLPRLSERNGGKLCESTSVRGSLDGKEAESHVSASLVTIQTTHEQVFSAPR